MKKSVLFLVSCAVSFSGAVAQVVSDDGMQGVKFQDLQSQKMVDVNMRASTRSVMAVKQMKETLVAAYDRPYGTYKPGISEEFGAYNPTLVGGGAYDTPWRFRNMTAGADETTTYSWQIGENIIEGDPELDYDILAQFAIGQYSTPILTVKKGSETSTYQYGTKKNIIGERPTQQFVFSNYPEYLPLSRADYNYGNNYAFSDNDHYIFGAGELGFDEAAYYSEKDGFKIIGAEDVIKAKGMVTYFEKPITPLFVSYITVPVFSAIKQPIPEDGVLKLEVRKLDENGKVDMESEPLITSQATLADMVQPRKEAPEAFVVKFPFIGYDEFGVPFDKEYVIDQAGAVVITGFDQEGADFSVYCADAMSLSEGGSTWLILEDGTYATYTISDQEEYQKLPRFDAYVQFNSLFPCLFMPSGEALVPKEGGLAKFEMNGQAWDPQFVSNFPATGDDAVEIISDVPSWMSVNPDESSYEQYQTIIYQVECEPLPEGTDGRRADLVFYSHGLTRTISIIQDPAAIAAHAAEQYKVVRNGEDFQLSYPTGATAVTIVNALGQNVAQYDLPANGSMTVSAAALSNGLNIFKFSGAGNIAVKAMK